MASGYEILLLLMMLFGVPSAFGTVPLEEDPALTRAVPRNAAGCVQWFGYGPIDPASSNRTERMVGEPEILALVAGVERGIRDALAVHAPDGELVVEAWDLVRHALMRPGCLFVHEIDVQTPVLEVALVLGMGERTPEAATFLRKLEGQVAASGNPADPTRTGLKVDDVTFRPFALPGTRSRLLWSTIDDRYVVIGAGHLSLTQVVRGLRGQVETSLRDAEAFRELQPRVAVDRPTFRTFLDVPRMLSMVPGATDDEYLMFQDFLGLRTARAIVSEAGLDGEGFAARSLLATRGAPSGLLGRFVDEPLEAEDLAIVPADATMAVVGRLSLHDLFQSIVQLIGSIDPRGGEEVGQMLRVARGIITVDIEKDLLAHLGDVVAAWSAPSEGGLLFSGATLAISIDDSEAFARSYRRVTGVLERAISHKRRGHRGFERGFYLAATDHDDTTIYYMNMVGDDFPMTLAWCATDDHLLLSVYPQMLKACLDRGLDLEKSLASVVPVDAKTTGVSYLDAETMARVLYPLAHPAAMVLAGELQREGVDLEMGLLPSMSSILPHMTSELATMSREPDGIALDRRGTLPMADPALAWTAPMLLGMAAWAEVRAVELRRAATIEAQRALEEAREAERERARRDR